MTAATIAIGLWAMLMLGRGTPLGRLMQRWLVAKPAAALSRINRQALLALGTLLAITLVCGWIMGHEGLLLVGFGFPELSMVLATIDLGIVLDIAVMVTVAGTAGGWQVMRGIVTRWRHPASRRPRAWRSRPVDKAGAANDDDRRPMRLAA